VIVPKPFTVHQSAHDGTQPPGRYYCWKSDYLPGVSDAQQTILERTSEFPRQSALIVFQLGGAAAGRRQHLGCGSPRCPYVMNIASSCIDPAKIDACKTWAQETWSAMRPHSTGGAYVNFLTEDEGDDRTLEAYGREKYDRLSSSKSGTIQPTSFRSTATSNLPERRRFRTNFGAAAGLVYSTMPRRDSPPI
jgi:hypothetical protein